jgi:hypothetical protein
MTKDYASAKTSITASIEKDKPKLTSEEHKHYYKEDLYFYYNEKHYIKNCDKAKNTSST